MARGKVKDDAECRLEAVRVRLTAAERQALDDLAANAGMTISEYARQRLGITLQMTDGESAEERVAMTR